jgi:hypothetical protein
LSFHNSKLFPLNFLISIFELFTIYFHLKNQYRKYPNVTRLITNPSQTLIHKGILLKPIIYLIPNVYFNIVQLFIAKKLSIKKEDTMAHTYKLHIDFYPRTQTGKTNNLFRAAPLMFCSSSSLFKI